MKGITREQWLAGIILACSLAIQPWLTPLALKPLFSPSNSILNWLPDAEETRQLRELDRTFLSERQPQIVCSWEGCTLDDPRVELFMQGFQSSKAPDGSKADWHVVSGKQILEQMTQDAPELSYEQSRRRMQGYLVGRDGETSVIMLTPPATMAVAESIRTTYQVAQECCQLEKSDVRLTGGYVNQHALDRETFGVFFPFSVLAGLVTLVVTWVCLRSLLLVGQLMIAAAGGVGYGLAAMTLGNVTMSALHTMLPALWFILSISAGTHLLNYLRESVAQGAHRPVATAVRLSLRPCISAVATTAVGLLSLGVSQLLPVREFGLWATVGLLLSTLNMYLILPALLVVLRAPKWKWTSHTRMDSAAEKLWKQLTHWKTTVVSILVLGSVVLMCGLPRLRLVAGFYPLFDESTTIRQDLAWFEQNIGPQQGVLATLRTPVESNKDLAELFKLCAHVQAAIERDNSSSKCLSPTQWIEFPPERSGLAGVIARSAFQAKLASKSDMLIQSGMLSVDRSTVLLNIQLPTHLGEEDLLLTRLAGVIHQEIQRRQANQATFELTGLIPLRNAIRKELKRSLAASLLITGVLVAVAMWIGLGSLGLAAVSILPNAFPTVFAFGVMGWAKLPIDLGSMMTASIALGIAVDDTLHFLVAYQRQRLPVAEAVHQAIKLTLFPILCTSLICGAGMLVFLACDFVAAARFGALLSAMLAAALIGDLILLPALLLLTGGRARNHTPTGIQNSEA
ncbi:MAG: MMPL family transporter [Planctomycetales bacterium]|nr:MMPL family transporter [Planctomycetales bacterium]